MYIVTVIGRDGKRRQYGYSKVKEAGWAAVRQSKNGALSTWIDELSEWSSVYNPVRVQLCSAARETVYG